MLEILAALSASAAGGMRIALPLLVIGLTRQASLWSEVPILWRIHPQVVLGVLVSWTLCELILAKSLMGQRVQQIVQLLFSPLAGAILGVAVAWRFGMDSWLAGLIGAVGGALALVIQLVQTGWFFRLRGLPIWVSLAQDVLSVALVLLAFDAPQQGGIIALLLLWLALRSSTVWRQWYLQQAEPGALSRKGSGPDPRQGKSAPD
ncbi:MAG: DUF4126 domain-containing protein [Synechococcales cyanobacterium CRU_2_2]|nr:DUF4126 domain-containing protein [Synechococcales cyanobacterium CRU_2_2]